MNLPNKLTILRVIMIPLYMWMYLSGKIYIAAAIFVIASLTDFLDGQIARKNNLVTNFGKFADPLADKLLVTAALLCFLEKDVVCSVIVMIILAREFIVTGLRMVAASDGIVIAAGMLGKLKTVSQMIAIIAAMLINNKLYIDILMYIAVFFTAVSGIDYIVRNIGVLKGNINN